MQEPSLTQMDNILKLYQGKPPGSEDWDWQEGKNNRNSMNVMTVYNVVHPTLTVCLADPVKANGTSIIVCPGGGFHFLAVDHEGTDIANALTDNGITVFLLRYRLVHVDGDNPFDDMLSAVDHKAWDDESLPIIPLAVADGRQAIAYVRSHANQYNISPERIGIMGFSAGGMVAASTAFQYDSNNRPDFVVPIYADIPESVLKPMLPDAPPLYLACTQDDEFGFAIDAIRMYNKWYEAGRPAELHLFAKGGHGFGLGSPLNTTFEWISRFLVWLKTQGLTGEKGNR
jgi:acetyl esterase/lipase